MKNVRALVTTAVLLALTVVFQNIRLLIGVNPVSTYLTGTLVNTCLIIAVLMVNVFAGLSISVLAPLVALLQQYAQAPMVPWIMAGNAALALIYWLIASRGERTLAKFIVAGVIAAILKFGVILLGNALVLAGKGQAFEVALGTASGLQLQQLITALIAIAISWAVLIPLKKAVK